MDALAPKEVIADLKRREEEEYGTGDDLGTKTVSSSSSSAAVSSSPSVPYPAHNKKPDSKSGTPELTPEVKVGSKSQTRPRRTRPTNSQEITKKSGSKYSSPATIASATVTSASKKVTSASVARSSPAVTHSTFGSNRKNETPSIKPSKPSPMSTQIKSGSSSKKTRMGMTRRSLGRENTPECTPHTTVKGGHEGNGNTSESISETSRPNAIATAVEVDNVIENALLLDSNGKRRASSSSSHPSSPAITQEIATNEKSSSKSLGQRLSPQEHSDRRRSSSERGIESVCVSVTKDDDDGCGVKRRVSPRVPLKPPVPVFSRQSSKSSPTNQPSSASKISVGEPSLPAKKSPVNSKPSTKPTPSRLHDNKPPKLTPKTTLKPGTGLRSAGASKVSEATPSVSKSKLPVGSGSNSAMKPPVSKGASKSMTARTPSAAVRASTQRMSTESNNSSSGTSTPQHSSGQTRTSLISSMSKVPSRVGGRSLDTLTKTPSRVSQSQMKTPGRFSTPTSRVSKDPPPAESPRVRAGAMKTPGSTRGPTRTTAVSASTSSLVTPKRFGATSTPSSVKAVPSSIKRTTNGSRQPVSSGNQSSSKAPRPAVSSAVKSKVASVISSKVTSAVSSDVKRNIGKSTAGHVGCGSKLQLSSPSKRAEALARVRSHITKKNTKTAVSIAPPPPVSVTSDTSKCVPPPPDSDADVGNSSIRRQSIIVNPFAQMISGDTKIKTDSPNSMKQQLLMREEAKRLSGLGLEKKTRNSFGCTKAPLSASVEVADIMVGDYEALNGQRSKNTSSDDFSASNSQSHPHSQMLHRRLSGESSSKRTVSDQEFGHENSRQATCKPRLENPKANTLSVSSPQESACGKRQGLGLTQPFGDEAPVNPFGALL